MGEWIRSLIAEWNYAGVAFLMLLETVFPPIPSEIIMSLAGLAAARGAMTLWGAILAGSAGAMMGNVAWYFFARWLSQDRLFRLVDRFGRWLTVDRRAVERADTFFDRYDRWFVFIGRMVPSIRSLVSVPAGLFGMKLRPFLIWSSLGTIGWSSGLAVAGHTLGTRYAEVDRYIGPVANGVIVLGLVWYLYRVATWKPRQ